MPAVLLQRESRLPASSQYKQWIIEKTVSTCGLFAGLSTRERAALVDTAWIKTLHKGEHLFHQSHQNQGLCLVQSGAVRLYRVNGRGQEQVVHIARAGECFAEESLVSDAGCALNAAAIQTSRLVILPKNEFLRFLKSCPELLFRVLHVLSAHFREIVGLVDDLRLKTVRTRLLNWLLSQCRDRESLQPAMVVLNIPKRVLASELGMASETFSRTLADLQADHLIKVQGRTIVLFCPRDIHHLVEDEDSSSGSFHPEKNSCQVFATAG